MRTVAEIATEPDRGISRDRTATIEDVSNPPRGNGDIQRKPVGAELASCQFALEPAAGMYNWCHSRFPQRPGAETSLFDDEVLAEQAFTILIYC